MLPPMTHHRNSSQPAAGSRVSCKRYGSHFDQVRIARVGGRHWGDQPARQLHHCEVCSHKHAYTNLAAHVKGVLFATQRIQNTCCSRVICNTPAVLLVRTQLKNAAAAAPQQPQQQHRLCVVVHKFLAHDTIMIRTVIRRSFCAALDSKQMSVPLPAVRDVHACSTPQNHCIAFPLHTHCIPQRPEHLQTTPATEARTQTQHSCKLAPALCLN
ncbi:hypothetical protein COO60DRAFT_586400 [Scenedesmus sp. NREL 46B-D3]|nr:hypothetical protein COO60DRAFT_586400 [Scenedesmus sp. NREL 46B-D3]